MTDESPVEGTVDSTADFVVEVMRAPSFEAVRDLFRAEIAKYGFNASVCGEIAPRTLAGPPRFFFNDWPESWMQLYVARNFLSEDFVVSSARQRIAPFAFTEVCDPRRAPPLLREMWGELNAFGWREGLAVPIHGPGGYAALVTAVGAEECLPPAVRTRLHLLAFYAHERCRQLDATTDEQRIATLTPRELECLRWVAAGKSDWDISQILGIARTTVKFHVDSGKAKLAVKTRSQATAILVLRGLI